jgi:hypothetical protein
VIATLINGATAVFAADVDGDGDSDVLSASFFDSWIAWYENLDGGGAFGPPRSISAVAAGAFSVWAGDLDGDGDTDALSAAQESDTIAWHENESGDCNGNGLPDGCDVGSGESEDCSGNGIPDECEPDCNGNGLPDSCDIVLGTSTDCDLDGFPDECLPSVDCNANGVPDPCDAGCVDCDADGDGCLDAVDSDPGDPMVCGDSDGDDCDDCRSGHYDPENDGPDSDGDGICVLGDCDPGEGTVWGTPGSITDLLLDEAAGSTTLTWRAPPKRGAVFLRYDVLRSNLPSDFVFAATCIEGDETDRSASDAQDPAPGTLFHYLVRVENDCPASTMGADSAGRPRQGRACP